MGSNPGLGTSVLWRETLPLLLCPSDGTLSRRFSVLGLAVHVTEHRTLIVEEQGLTSGFLVHMASTLVYSIPRACELL